MTIYLQCVPSWTVSVESVPCWRYEWDKKITQWLIRLRSKARKSRKQSQEWKPVTGNFPMFDFYNSDRGDKILRVEIHFTDLRCSLCNVLLSSNEIKETLLSSKLNFEFTRGIAGRLAVHLKTFEIPADLFVKWQTRLSTFNDNRWISQIVIRAQSSLVWLWQSCNQYFCLQSVKSCH